jgi:RNA polymerase sigma-70 factor (sigma-E family)
LTFEAYAEAHLGPLFRFATVLAGERGLAEDVVMEALIRVRAQWERIGGLDQRDAYVRRMVVNEYLSWRRKWSRLVPVAEPAERTGQGNLADEHAVREELVAQLRRLPRRQRAAVVLRFYEDLDDAEIAEMLGCRAVTVRGYISRALRTLRVELMPSEPVRLPREP